MRLKYGEFNKLSDEEKREHRRELQRRWRSSHKEFVKEQNKKWYNIYVYAKPATCTCIKCGNQFRAPRKYFKICQTCLVNRKVLKEQERKRKLLKLKNREVALEMLLSGIKQVDIANKLNVSQSVVSSWIRKAGYHYNQITQLYDKE